jgi:predicted NodU family carbamoyl transferase
MAELYLGTARARLGPAAALIDTERGVVAACEENRLTRAVEAATTEPPDRATDELLRFMNRRREDIARAGGVGDEGDIDAHLAHAEYAFRASGFDESVVLVCEAHLARGWTARRFVKGSVVPIGEEIADYPIAAAYGRLTQSLGFQPMRDEHLVEAMARAGHEQASAVQRQLGDDLLKLLSELKALSASNRICLSGGLFFNTYFTTLAASSGLFADTFIPPHPGRNGTAVGAALLVGGRGDVSSPYLGPSYADDEIKSTLENCKLSFDLMHQERLMDDVLHAIARGRLVGWYHGRLEWGPRALGHRSVLADPFSAHVLENLNAFLKRRPAYRAYGVSVPAAKLSDYFVGGPASSPFMQYEYVPRDPEKFRTILPPGVKTLRVHTVDDSEPRFLRLLELRGQASGMPVLVNTSFNGFHEPLVCSPRDAIRVFYGTGLDLLALEDFHLRK